ncbi:MAG TPA: serine hydrolase domain-containing protein [Vicinamibacterales bacterium]|nr:serine hydrolase domain-containing protein [Vicinamibacterales bacterium]
MKKWTTLVSAPLALAAILGALLAPGSITVRGQTASPESAVDAVFARWTDTTPGCAVGVSVGGKTTLTKAYGMADLERNVRNTPETIFEAGSLSKQFTAAAVLLLAHDGKLSLDDPVRKYIPEVPDYGAPLTIRHMLNHTSGLRDWGSVAGIGGWPRTTRAYTHAHVLDIVSRQRSLNFPSGTRYSYSNSGYNLAAILVSRVSGMPFAEFSQQRVFGPLGMTRTSWRDDHRRIVKDRAIAYSEEGETYRTLMPFENVHGNGGLLTTVGDLLTWNHNFETHLIGDASFVREQETAGRFNDGRPHRYALGLMVGRRHGLREVSHSGSTAGYRAHLTRFPDQRVSVAVLCNGSGGNATQYTNTIAELYLAGHAKPTPTVKATHRLSPQEAGAATGMFRNTVTGEAVTVTRDDDGVRVDRAAYVAASGRRFVNQNGGAWEVDGRGAAKQTDAYGSVDTFERVSPVTPAAAELIALAGVYVSEDAETTLVASVEGGTLVLERRPDTVIALTPTYKDAFSSSIGTIVFRRGGKTLELSIVQDRVWDMRFARRDLPTNTSQR